MKALLAGLGLFLGLSGAAMAADLTPQAIYQQNCATCHGADRLGGMGPALLPESLERLRKSETLATVTKGRVATQMPAFSPQLSTEQIQALVDYLYTPVAEAPRWGEAEIRQSRVVYYAPGSLPSKPCFKADLQNLFVVVETGDHHATILDGDRLEPIHRFKTRFALHGGPKFSPDGRFVYFASRDGWISKFDIYNLKTVAEIRAGVNTRNLAVSDDGKYVLVGNYLPGNLVLLDAEDLSLMKVIPAKGLDGKDSRVSAVYQAAPRKSFIVALKDTPEVWEIPYGSAPKQKAWVHDYGPNSGEMLVGPPSFKVRRIPTSDSLDDFFFDQSYTHLMGAGRAGKWGQVLDLDTGKQVADLDLPGMPHLGSGITWDYQGHPVMATPDLKEGVVSIIDMTTWKTIKQIKTLGPGFFMRSHENTPYAWTDAMMSPNKDAMLLIDKRTLEIAKVLRPSPGKAASHVEFTRDGKYALVSIWEQDGALVVYDTATFQEVKRIPMCKPSGKYNVYNKTTRSAGTSH
ncbi:MAG TPA: cytochrome D1 domain-containing protein [Stenomitos sp.]